LGKDGRIKESKDAERAGLSNGGRSRQQGGGRLGLEEI